MADNLPEKWGSEDPKADGPEVSFVEIPSFSLPFLGPRPRLDYPRIIAGTLIGLAVLAIALFSLTNLSVALLPMDELYMNLPI